MRQPRRSGSRRRPLRPDLPGAAASRARFARWGTAAMIANASLPRADQDALHQLMAIVRPWRGLIAVIALLVIMAAVAQLAPPLIVRRMVDEQLTVGRTDQLLALALLYLAATAGAQALIFGYGYLAAVV